MSAGGVLFEKKSTEELFTSIDYTDRDQIAQLFPEYVQEQYKLKKQRVKNISKAVDIEDFTLMTPFADQTLLKDTYLKLEPNRRQVLYGSNGTGKTLLFMNMVENKIKGFPKHIHIHHCRELETHELGDTVLGTVINSNPYLNMLKRVEAKLTQLKEEAEAADQKKALNENLLWIQECTRSIKGYDAVERASKMLRVLGFDEIGMKKLVSALSGGLRMRVALCMAFFIEADLLLLDEPTNHLDFPSVLWLENRLRGYSGSFLLVSHDRELLNNVCQSVLLLEDKQIKYYNMGFKEFEKTKAAEDKKKFEEIEKFLKRNQNADPATLLGKQKAEKSAWSEAYHRRQIALAGKFTFPASKPLSTKEVGADGKPIPQEQISLINLQNVRFSYDVSTGIFIFNDPISFNVTASTRVGVMGPNGAGKSTFLKLLTKKIIPTEGKVEPHPNFSLAYFGQHSTAELDLKLTPSEFMQREFPKHKPEALRSHLAKTSIVDGVADTRMERLSFSQRSCVIFAKLTFIAPHLLILDEPTNFLDLESVDSLITACNKYKGALLLVSHNRDFLRKCASQYLSIVPGKFDLYDNMKEAEKATYTFIQEMEEGGKVGADALKNNPGGGTVVASQKIGGAPEEKKATPATGVAKPATAGAAAAAPAAVQQLYTVGEKVQAKWTDGKWYAGVVKKFENGKYTVTYTQYGNSAILPAAGIKKAAPAGK